MIRSSILLGLGTVVLAIGSAFTTANNFVEQTRFYLAPNPNPSEDPICTPVKIDADCETSMTVPDCEENTPHGLQQLYNTNCQSPLIRE